MKPNQPTLLSVLLWHLGPGSQPGIFRDRTCCSCLTVRRLWELFLQGPFTTREVLPVQPAACTCCEAPAVMAAFNMLIHQAIREPSAKRRARALCWEKLLLSWSLVVWRRTLPALVCYGMQVAQSTDMVLGDSIGPLNVHQRDPAVLLQPFLPEPLCDGARRHLPQSEEVVPTESLCDVSYLQVNFASYNVPSLASPSARQACQLQGEGLAFRVARPALLARSLADCEVDIASIQETRCAAGTLFTGEYFRVCGGADNGQYGTELWFRIGRPILRLGGRCVCIRPNQVVVHQASPRRLLVSIEPSHAKLRILATRMPNCIFLRSMPHTEGLKPMPSLIGGKELCAYVVKLSGMLTV